MEIKLDIPRGKRQQEFMDYFNSMLRLRTHSYGGSAGLNEEGFFESTTTGPFPLDQGTVQLTWVATKDKNGTLLKIDIETVTPVETDTWKLAVQEFVTSVLATAFSEKRQKFFRRSFFFYIGPQLDGEYWLPGYRFAPAFLEDPQPHLINAERVVSIDQELEAIDELHASTIADEVARRHAARLSLLLNTGLYKHDYSLRWVVPERKDESAPQSLRLHLGFTHPSLHLTQMPNKGQLCPLGGYKGSLTARYRVAGELQSLPPEARKILRGIDSSDPLVVDAFDRGARLYQVASVCGQIFPSVGLAYRVAAVEAISKVDNECKGFSDFMRKYISSQREIEPILDYLYGSARSAHFHGGEFLMGEFSRSPFSPDPLMDSEAVERYSFHRLCYELTREAIVNWLSQMIPDIPETAPERTIDTKRTVT